LELLFDLTFVAAVAGLTVPLVERIASGDAGTVVVPFLQVFFAIWWAWMNFTWFASSYDTDDVPYRIRTLVQMAGVLVLAAGVPAGLNDNNYSAVTVGYLIMRTGLVALWIRVGAEEPLSRPTARRYVLGIAIAEVGWLLRLWLHERGVLGENALLAAFIGLVAVELAIPRWAERARPTNWHPHHVAERYGLFVILLLGEGVIAASLGFNRTVQAGGVDASHVTIATAGLVLVFAVWWIYFLEPCGKGLAANRDRSYLWGYGHYGVFAALAALGAGLELAVEHGGEPVHVSATVVSAAVALPLSVFLVLVWAVKAPVVPGSSMKPAVFVGGAALVGVAPLATSAVGLPAAIVAMASVCAGVIAITLVAGPDWGVTRRR
jgi:low temperature requirement protein LtrA